MFKRIIPLLIFLSFLNAQIALPTFQAFQKPQSTAISSLSLFDFTTHTFTNCGQTGHTGPSLSTCKTWYQTNSNGTSSAWRDNADYFNMEVNGIQLWTVPADGTYRIEVWGAQGVLVTTDGNWQAGGELEGGGGKGARMRGDFDLNQGEKIKILVGQMGRGEYAASGGGGGTFVAKYDNTALIVAGGGGGNRRNNNFNTAMNAVTSTSGADASNVSDTGGSGGNGGTSGSYSGSGAGFTGDGVKSSDSRSMHLKTKASSFINGGVGGQLQYSTAHSYMQGGFGGGGAGGWGGTGAGGGYSGGGGGTNSNSSYAGGGGSYNNGSNQSNEGGLWESHGKCTITKQ